MDESEINAKENSYMLSKYTPLTVRLSEHIAKNKGWSGESVFVNIEHIDNNYSYT